MPSHYWIIWTQSNRSVYCSVSDPKGLNSLEFTALETQYIVFGHFIKKITLTVYKSKSIQWTSLLEASLCRSTLVEECWEPIWGWGGLVVPPGHTHLQQMLYGSVSSLLCPPKTGCCPGHGQGSLTLSLRKTYTFIEIPHSSNCTGCLCISFEFTGSHTCTRMPSLP